ncbi:uncharacterized protein [Solanum tuberosum]|uniref:Ribosomal protein L32 n=1 Tax=Solanum tuberosum TaxID=4113 RepID=M1A3U2_SOLTU|nr:PREDICTED: uncharacterized protein LOC102589553 isoform X2 [Solanum tuberosum]
MASTVAKLRSIPNFINGLRRFSHAISIPPPLDSTIYLQTAASPSLVLPEHDNNNNNNIGFMVPNSPFLGGSMELMAVPKKKDFGIPYCLVFLWGMFSFVVIEFQNIDLETIVWAFGHISMFRNYT